MSARAVAAAPIRLYRRLISPALGAALQVPPVLLGVRAAGDQDLRHTARRRAGRLAAPALQPVEPRRLRPRRAATPLPPARGFPLMTIPVANVLQPLIDVANAILEFWHDDVGFSWGVSIIMLTVVVRLAILPLTFKQVRSMQELQRLQPEMKRIQERYKEDRQRMNQEMMKLYQEHKVNPLGSCLPILLQLPFFIALFYLLRGDEFQNEIAGEESFLFIDNLAEPATGRDARRADRALRRRRSSSRCSITTVTRGPDAAADHACAAVRLRHLRHQLRDRADRLLDHDERLDDRPAARWCGSCSRSRRRSSRSPTPGSKPARGQAAARPGPRRRRGEGRAREGPKAEADGGPKKGPPPGPRKKKKRTGRRR